MKTVKLSELAALVGGTLEGHDVAVSGVKGIEQAGAGDITFIANPKYAKYALLTQAAALILLPGITVNKPCIRTPEPYYAFMTVLRFFIGETPVPKGIHPSAVIGEGSTVGADPSIQAQVCIGKNVVIGDRVVLYPGVVVGDNCRIGNHALLYANVVLREGTVVGNHVIIQPGAVIGSDGFGYVKQDGKYLKIPQVGTVIIEDDVEIGANTTIDRATLNATIIRRGVKIDNLVQVAHNVEIGEHTAVAAQAGISGSTRIGKRVIVAGQAGFVGHIKIGDDAILGAQAGISKDVEPGAKLTGTPARDLMAMRRVDAASNHLPEALKEIKRLREELDELKKNK